MKHIVFTLFTLHFSIFTCLLASPFAPGPAREIVVYSEPSTKPLHVETVVSNAWEKPKRWTFPSSYSGHRAVCALPGAATNNAFIARFGGDKFAPGDLIGTSRYLDTPAFNLTRTSPITARINPWTGESDRTDSSINDAIIRSAVNDPNLSSWLVNEEMRKWYAGILSNRVHFVKPDPTKPVRVRVVRYAIDDYYCYRAGVYGQGGGGYEQRTVLDKTFGPSGRDFLCEADFLFDYYNDIEEKIVRAFDIDSRYLYDEVVDADSVIDVGLAVTNMSYLVVIGDGPTSFSGSRDTNTTVNAAGIITRRFERRRNPPVVENVVAVINGKRPVFRWSIPSEESWAKEYGTSYTQFRIWIEDKDGSIYNSGTRRMPRANDEGKHEFIADFVPGDSSAPGQEFSRPGSWMFYLSVRNSKWASGDVSAVFSTVAGPQN